MPELPETETIRKGLRKYVVGHTIKDIEIIHPGPLQGDIKKIIGTKIIGARRIGKGLILDLSNKYSLAIHIKLTGQLIYRGPETQRVKVSETKVGTTPNKFTHVIFHLNKPGDRGQKQEAVLYYNDQRRFGWIKIIRTNDVLELPFFKNMGPEPFAGKTGSGQADLTLDRFKKAIENKTTKIKPLIMDQSVIGGIGNIYANDALFRAKVDPSRPAKSLSNQDAKLLYDSIIAVMEKSFKEGGASELSFVNILGQEGNYQNHSLVYGKKGKSCPRLDGGTIKRIDLGGRGTFYCPACQR